MSGSWQMTGWCDPDWLQCSSRGWDCLKGKYIWKNQRNTVEWKREIHLTKWKKYKWYVWEVADDTWVGWCDPDWLQCSSRGWDCLRVAITLLHLYTTVQPPCVYTQMDSSNRQWTPYIIHTTLLHECTLKWTMLWWCWVALISWTTMYWILCILYAEEQCKTMFKWCSYSVM